jgi:hypothetical protein
MFPQSSGARRIAAVCIAAMLCACSPDYPPPDGFEEACYGGDFSRKLDGATPSFSMYLHATQKDWPEVARRIQQLGQQQALRYFDTSVRVAGLRMLSVHLCSPKGLWLNADKRLWDASPDPMPDEMPIHLYVYEEAFAWKPIAQQLEQSFADWPTPARIEWHEANSTAAIAR